MYHDADIPVTRDPETDPGAEFKERAIGTAFDILDSVRETCQMAIPGKASHAGRESHPVTLLREHLDRILGPSDKDVQFREIDDRIPSDREHRARVAQGEDPGAHLNLAIRVWNDDGGYDNYTLHVNTSGGGLVGRRIVSADFHDAARQQGGINHARRSEGDAYHPLEMGVTLTRRDADSVHTISEVRVETSTIPRPEGQRILIIPSVAAGTYATDRDEILLMGDREGTISNPIRQEHADQDSVNTLNSRLIEQARVLYALRREAREKNIRPDDGFYNFTSIESLLGVHSTAVSA